MPHNRTAPLLAAPGIGCQPAPGKLHAHIRGYPLQHQLCMSFGHQPADWPPQGFGTRPQLCQRCHRFFDPTGEHPNA